MNWPNFFATFFGIMAALAAASIYDKVERFFSHRRYRRKNEGKKK